MAMIPSPAKRLSVFRLLLCCLLMTATGSWAENAADDSTGRDDTPVFELMPDVDLVSTLKIQYAKPRIVVKSVFPQLESDHLPLDDFNQRVVDLVQAQIDVFQTDLTANGSSPELGNKRKNSLFIDFSSSFIRSGQLPILSIRFNVQSKTAGGEQTRHRHFVLNYDLENDIPIDLEELFKSDSDYLVRLSEYVRTELRQRLSDYSRLEEGTSPTAEHFQLWNIMPNGLLVTFEEEQVASRLQGTQTVLIPYSSLEDILNDDSPLTSCVKHHSRCANSNVLTGGFIDLASNTVLDRMHRFFYPILSLR